MADSGLLRELNRDVWHAFRAAYGARDAESFLALHTPDLIRAGGPDKQAHDFAEYAGQITQWFAELTERGGGIDIEFRFEERIASAELASERGVFRISATMPGDEDRVFYGRFHTFARKVDGSWRIAVDYDSTDAGTVGEDTFVAAVDLDDLAAFA